MNLYRYIPGQDESCPSFVGSDEGFDWNPIFQNTYSNCTNSSGLLQYPYEDICQYHVPLLEEDGDPIDVPEVPDTCFNYISNLLREDGSDDRPGTTLQDYMAAQMSYNNNASLLGEREAFNLITDGSWEFCHSAADALDHGVGRSRERRHDDEGEDEDGRKKKQSNNNSTNNEQVFGEMEEYGDVLMCPEGRSKPGGLCSSLKMRMENNTNTNTRGKKEKKKQVVDLRSLVMRCAQSVARVDLTGSYKMLREIRQHSTPYGDSLQRVAHYLANGLEARLEGKGYELSNGGEIPASDMLKANRVYVASVPFKIMSYYTTNKTIASLAEEAESIHIIDFGIMYGLQWPCIIQNLSRRPNGPPRIRMTGIDFPQPGFRPAERVEETGRCLAKYCERYNVGFEYYPIAKKWESIKIEELRIDRNEPLVVNCLYRSHNLFDESVEEDSPRDAFLRLVRKINPDVFMHGVVNTTFTVPFFLNRFKEILYHYTALFDLLEATMSRVDQERMILECNLYGKQALNVIACEGVQRLERPESYKQWQVRTQRAGFVQVPLDRDLLRRARAMVRRNFRGEFSYDEDGLWVVQGWKGRIINAISCWKPT